MDSEESNELNEEQKTENSPEVESTQLADGEETSEDTPVTDESSSEVIADQDPGDKAEALPETEQEEVLEERLDEISEETSQPIPPTADAAQVEALAEENGSEEDPFSEQRIQRILDIELPVNISFGSTKRPLSEVLKLGPGALLELDRDADEPVVLKVNNKVFATGEIVDVDGYYGVQISEIATPAQRIASLGE